MSLLKKLFAGQPKPKAASFNLPEDSPAFAGEPIKAFDKYGREISVSRRDWFESVLKGNLEKAWDDPDELSNLITSGFNDGFLAAMEAPVQRLQQIDPKVERGTVYLAVYMLQTDQPAAAESQLNKHIQQHGASGIVLTNLAKAQSALNREAEALQTLWHALELDPNQDNGLGWFEVIHREKDGEAAGVAALERVAALPGSWRAQLWLARHALKANRLDDAIALYQTSLSQAGDPTPTDLLMQMSGDLGNAGHLSEILTLVTPRFEPTQHGIQVGNNLIKANIDTGQLEAAKTILKKLQLQHRSDWQESLGFWETELSKAACATANTPNQAMPSVSLLSLEGPSIFKAKSPTAHLFPEKDATAPRICFIGSTAETTQIESGIKQQASDNPGRFSRGLPLLLAEYTYNQTSALTTTLLPWVAGDNASFVLSGVPWKDEDAANHARNGETPNDYVVISHLKARGENWTLIVHFVRTIDAKRLAAFEFAFAEFSVHTVIEQILADLQNCLIHEAEVAPQPHPQFALPSDTEINHYLFRLEQGLAVRCYAMEGSNPLGLSNPSEIINGMIQTCLQNPQNLSCRLLLLRSLAALKKIDPELTLSFREKIEALMQEHPLDDEVAKLIDEELNQILVA